MTALALSPDGRRLVTGGDAGTIKVWDTATWRELVTMKDHAHAVRGLAFTPDGRTLISVAYDGQAILREVDSQSETDNADEQDRRRPFAPSHLASR
jgi:WD40 repeat protein